MVEAAQIVCDADESCGDDGYLEIGQEKRDSDTVVTLASDLHPTYLLWRANITCALNGLCATAMEWRQGV